MTELGLLPVSGTIEGKFSELFPFKDFNRMQSRAVPLILGSGDNVVISAPTASGKTVLAEAAMVKELGAARRGKVLFIAPLRALTNEKESEWKHVLGKLGFKVYVVTGERELSPYEAKGADVIIATPEKWDSATRKYRQERYSFVKDVSLVIIDEVHLLDSDSRGGALEAVISRMKRISEMYSSPIRIIAMSATMPNIRDVARWVGASEENTLIFDNSYRPVELETKVISYNPKDNDFLNKYIRLYRAFDLIKGELEGGHQALIFVSTRQDTYQAADKLCEIIRKESPYFLLPPDIRRLQDIKSQISNPSLKSCLPCGIAFHHAGLSSGDKAAIENGFREGVIKVLVSTSTLAWGVNLPARVVVIRDVEIYDPIAGTKDISPIDLLQMLGRAGRPGYDTRGKGYVIVPYARVCAYQQLLKNGKPIESVLKYSLSEHLNAEIAVGMVKNVQDAVAWLKTTFLYVRAQSDPAAYGLSNIDSMVSAKIDHLTRNGFIMNNNGELSPTPLGTITSDFYLKLATAMLFKEQASRSSLSTDEVLDIISRSAEFSDVVTRPGEPGSIKSLSGQEYGPGGSAKVRAVLNGYINRSIPDELRSDAWAIKQNASRLISAFARFCEEYSGPALSNKVRMVSVQIEKGVPEEAIPLAAIPGVGDRSLDILFRSGIKSPQDIAGKKPEDLIRMGIRGPLAIDIIEAVGKLTHIEADMSGIPCSSDAGTLNASVSLRNSGGAGMVALCIKADGATVKEERFYIDAGAVKNVGFEVDVHDKDIPIKVSVSYIDTMLPVDEWNMVIKVLKTSVPEKAARIDGIANMRQGIYYIIAGTAHIDYSGRARDSYEGRAVVLVKPDSTIVVHSDSGVKPRNYMGQSGITAFSYTDGHVKIIAENNGEKLSIYFSEVRLLSTPFDGVCTDIADMPAISNSYKVATQKPELTGRDVAIERALRNMRARLSKDRGIPPYTIFNDRTLYDLIAKKPKSREDLLNIYGIGVAKAEKYGDMILAALNDGGQQPQAGNEV